MAKKPVSILIVDDEPLECSILGRALRKAGYSTATATSPLEAKPALAATVFDVVVSDLRMPGQDGLSFLRDLKRRRPEQAVIVITAYGSVETAVEAMKLGAFDYLLKPFSAEQLLLKLDRVLRYEQLATENEVLRRQLTISAEETRIIGESEAIRNVLAQIHSVAGTDTTVLIQGESGTGKEMAAKVIHETSYRAAGPFVPVACAALPKELVEAELFGHEAGAFTGATKRRLGRFELADGGTLFLDDVDDIPSQVQVKLLRVLQERMIERIGGEERIPVNVRVISATKERLSALVAAGKFREDLYYRLDVVPLHVPPLRDRLADIPHLVEHFLRRLAGKLNRGALTASPRALAKLQHYRWPGNVRELEHVLERMVVMNEKNSFDENDIPELMEPNGVGGLLWLDLDSVDSIDLTALAAELESRAVRWALDRSRGNLAQAAGMLAIPRSTLRHKVSKLAEAAPSSPGNE